MKSICHHYDSNHCRSCEWITLAYPEQLLKKESILHLALGLDRNFVCEPTVASPTRAFRNRAKMAVTGTVENPIIGLTGDFHAKQKLDQGRELLDCPIHHPQINELLTALPFFIRENGLTPYHIKSRQGELKGLVLFYSPLSHQMLLRFVLRSKEYISKIKKALPVLQQKFPHLVCVSANIQPIPHAILEGKEEIFITTQTTLENTMQLSQTETLPLRLAPQAFVQTNSEIATELYQTAARWVATIQPKLMVDLFCGQGAFSFFAAHSAARIVGIEINAEAVKTATETALKLNFSHLTFECADVTTGALVAKNFSTLSPDLILVNPPRRGLGESIKMLLQTQPSHIIYSSCSIDSLTKDIQKLAELYTIKKIQLFDLFPHTEHFETLVLLKRKPPC